MGGSKSDRTMCQALAVSRDILRSEAAAGLSFGRGWAWGRPCASQRALISRWKPPIHLRHTFLRALNHSFHLSRSYARSNQN